ncbi:hypothetical protein G4Y79_23880 [Phototrophicus methaneseepsis]|uniref:Uncharacterized protein n=1 Tax=Phototrophicus methaneseepsis TaxID=2710758 RepID=A0A7S8E972_9CHLR|nr:hypothetical protein [Phototrophicus methaneseepsis]QPC82687.1 hypothetical protein G4Y79_23880 [Phototrophicus methaneseepsis]
MPISVSWHEKETNVILYQFSQTWTWSELYRAAKRAMAMPPNGYGMTYSLLDWTQTEGFPAGPGLMHMSSVMSIQPSHRALTIMASAHPQVRLMVNMVHKTYPQRVESFLVAQTLDEAITQIRNHKCRYEGIRLIQPRTG